MRYFITSTGTGLGKTFITAAMARQAKARGKNVMAYKPLISGFDSAKLEESDTGILLRSLGLPQGPENIERMSPWRFAAPLAPSMAARLENRKLDFEKLIAHSHQAMKGIEDIVLIEGVGGVMAPIDDQHTVLDWIEVLDIQSILVVGNYLGSLSHTLTALEALAHRQAPVFAVIVNESAESTVPLKDTVEELSRWTRLPIVPVTRRTTGDAGGVTELGALLG